MNQKNIQAVLRRFRPGHKFISWKALRLGSRLGSLDTETFDNILQYLLAQNIIEQISITTDLETLQGYRLKISFEEREKLLLL